MNVNCCVLIVIWNYIMVANGRGGGIRTPTQSIMLTTIVFTTLSVCGLDYTFIIPFGLDVPRLVSTPSSCDAWLVIAILQVSPNLRSYTHKVSQMRLNFHKSGVSTDSTILACETIITQRIIIVKCPLVELNHSKFDYESSPFNQIGKRASTSAWIRTRSKALIWGKGVISAL